MTIMKTCAYYDKTIDSKFKYIHTWDDLKKKS